MQYPEFNITAKAKNKVGVLVVSGYINPYNNNAGNQLVQAFEKLDEKHDEILIILRNCYGGDVYEGIPTFNHLLNSDKVNTRAEGLVASMGFMLFLSGKKREMAPMSRLMSHRIMSGLYGTSLQLRNTAEEMDKLEDDFKQAISNITGKTAEYITNNWMKEGVDKYFNTTEAKEAGLATDLIPGKETKNALPENLFTQDNIHNVAQFYNQLLNQQQPNIEDKMKLNAASNTHLGLEAGASEEAVNMAIANLAQEKSDLQDQNTQLQNKFDAEQDARIANLVNAAVKAGKITADKVDQFTQLGKTNMAVLENTLEALPTTKKVPINNSSNGSTEDRSTWTAEEWRKKDTAGFLAMKKDNPEEYERLNKAVKFK